MEPVKAYRQRHPLPPEIQDQLDQIKKRLAEEGYKGPASLHPDYKKVYAAWAWTTQYGEEQKSRRKEYYKKHRERLIAKQREYEKTHVEELKAYRKRTTARRTEASKKWKAENPERHKAQRKAWESRNRHVIRMHIALRRAREVAATIGDPKEIAAWEKEWKSRPTNICEWCQCETPTEFCQSDHAEPLTNGGAHHLSNLVIACKWCNFKKRNKPLSVWLDWLEKATSEEKDKKDSHPNFPKAVPTLQTHPPP